LVYGDCTPDTLIDDFWTFYDGDFDGVTDGCNPADTVVPAPDGIADGRSVHPLCDLYSEDLFQAGSLSFYHAYTLLVANLLHFATTVDVIRGNVDQLAWGASEVALGPVTCVKEDGVVITDNRFVVNDLQTPPSGTAWYYLARLTSVPSPVDYGYGFSNCLPRTTSLADGDCQP
jgi:hypothetical protein